MFRDAPTAKTFMVPRVWDCVGRWPKQVTRPHIYTLTAIRAAVQYSNCEIAQSPPAMFHRGAKRELGASPCIMAHHIASLIMYGMHRSSRRVRW